LEKVLFLNSMGSKLACFFLLLFSEINLPIFISEYHVVNYLEFSQLYFSVNTKIKKKSCVEIISSKSFKKKSKMYKGELYNSFIFSRKFSSHGINSPTFSILVDSSSEFIAFSGSVLIPKDFIVGKKEKLKIPLFLKLTNENYLFFINIDILEYIKDERSYKIKKVALSLNPD
jgi:hypothetical protein